MRFSGLVAIALSISSAKTSQGHQMEIRGVISSNSKANDSVSQAISLALFITTWTLQIARLS